MQVQLPQKTLFVSCLTNMAIVFQVMEHTKLDDMEYILEGNTYYKKNGNEAARVIIRQNGTIEIR